MLGLLKQYKDLTKDSENYNAWKSDETFPIGSLKDEPIVSIEKFSIDEYIFNGVQSNRYSKNHDELLLKFKNGIEEFLSSQDGNNYLFAIEHKPQLISRIRSFKGVFDKEEVSKESVTSYEKELDNKTSVIAAVSIIKSSNINYLLNNFFFDSNLSFIINSEKDYLSQGFLENVIECITIKSSSVYVNYLKLMMKFCSIGDDIYRIGGDGGEEYWSFQRLYQK